LVEVWEADATGSKALIGYAICNPDGEEIDFFGAYNDALDAFRELTDDSEPPSGYEP